MDEIPYGETCCDIDGEYCPFLSFIEIYEGHDVIAICKRTKIELDSNILVKVCGENIDGGNCGL